MHQPGFCTRGGNGSITFFASDTIGILCLAPTWMKNMDEDEFSAVMLVEIPAPFVLYFKSISSRETWMTHLEMTHLVRLDPSWTFLALIELIKKVVHLYHHPIYWGWRSRPKTLSSNGTLYFSTLLWVSWSIGWRRFGCWDRKINLKDDVHVILKVLLIVLWKSWIFPWYWNDKFKITFKKLLDSRLQGSQSWLSFCPSWGPFPLLHLGIALHLPSFGPSPVLMLHHRCVLAWKRCVQGVIAWNCWNLPFFCLKAESLKTFCKKLNRWRFQRFR